MSNQNPYPIIELKDALYGYLVALKVEAACPEVQTPQRMLATFEMYGEPQTWEVPTCALFKKLWHHLYGEALHHYEHGDYGSEEVLIWQGEDGEWHVGGPWGDTAEVCFGWKLQRSPEATPLAHGVRGQSTSPTKKETRLSW